MSDDLIARLERAARRNQMDKGDHDVIHAAIAALAAERTAREQAEQERELLREMQTQHCPGCGMVFQSGAALSPQDGQRQEPTDGK
jgi:hypothetical protein